MMRARGSAYQALEEGEPASALAHVNRGILDIKNHFEKVGRPDAFTGAEEVKMLRALAGELSGKVPTGSVLLTRRALRTAIEQERFEDAARLRDELKNMLPPDA
jgi:UvrB/UvrC motif-containing protein